MKRKPLLFVILIAIALLQGCYPKGAEFVDELDVAIGRYDGDYNFKGPKTYFMPDTVVHIKNGEENEDVDHDNDELLLNEIENHLKGLGYTRVFEEDNPELPDLVVMVSTVISTTYYWSGYPCDWWNWWGWYPGWGYWPGWGGGCWGYPWYPTVYSLKTGSVVIDMVDPIQPLAEGQINAYYWGAVNGLLQGSDQYIQSRIKVGLEDLFNQPPFESFIEPL